MTWTTIPDSDIDPDSPVTTGLMTALRDNVAATANGDSGAPDIIENALTAITAGSSYRLMYGGEPDIEYPITNTAYEKLDLSIIIPRTGSYQVSFEIQGQAANTANGRIYKNTSTAYSGDAAVGTERTRTDGTWTEYTETLSLNAGDMLSLYGKATGVATVKFRNFRIESVAKLFG